MVSNLAGELLGRRTATGRSTRCRRRRRSTSRSRPTPPGVRVTLPDGTVEQLAPGATGASSVTFVSTRQLGVYRAEVMPGAGAERLAGGHRRRPSPTPQPQRFARRGRRRHGRTSRCSSRSTCSRPTSRTSARATARASRRSAPPCPRRRPRRARPATSSGRCSWRWRWCSSLVEWLVYERDGARRILNALRPRTRSPLVARERRPARRGLTMQLPFTVARPELLVVGPRAARRHARPEPGRAPPPGQGPAARVARAAHRHPGLAGAGARRLPARLAGRSADHGLRGRPVRQRRARPAANRRSASCASRSRSGPRATARPSSRSAARRSSSACPPS